MYIKKEDGNKTALDFVKTFLRRYLEEYDESYPVNFARDCSLMKKVMNKLRRYGRPVSETNTFLRWAWKRRSYYINNKYSRLKIGLLYSIVDDYISSRKYKLINLNISDEERKQLDKEMKEWIKKRNK